MSLRIAMCVIRPLRSYRPAAKSTALLWATVLAALSCTGCLRIGYKVQQEKDAGAGMPDGGPAYTGSRAVAAGGGGAGGKQAAAGARGMAGAAAGGTGGARGQAGQAGRADDADAGGVPHDAGSAVMDAGAADSGTPITYQLCPEMPGILFCSSFEQGGARWTSFNATNGSTTPLTTLPRTGAYSLVAVTYGAAALSEARWTSEVLAQQKSGEIWMRFYNFIPSSVTVNEYFAVGRMSETVAPLDGFEFRLLPSGVDINTSGGAIPGKANVIFPPNTWVCVEMHVVIDDKLGIYEAYLDGKLAVQSDQRDTLPGDGYTAAEIGVRSVGPNQSGVQVFVDDVVIARTRVGCN